MSRHARVPCMQSAPQKMIVFDIETTGLNNSDKVTVICTEDFESGRKQVYNFGKAACETDRQHLIDALTRDFDAATSLCAYNGIRFDLPFMQKDLKIPADKITQWVLKTSDILEQLRLRESTMCKLDHLCDINNIAMKSSDGCAAVRMAREGQWDKLEDYCANDVHILCELYRKRTLNHPHKKGAYIDLQAYACDGFYSV
jgi:hypothetical protein